MRAATSHDHATRLPELSALLSLRFVAALGVFLLHVSNVVGSSLYPGQTIAQWPAWLQVMHEGYYRQTFFLMLSGFILIYVYHRGLRQQKSGFRRRFLVRRVARIWPLHMLMLVSMVPGVLDDIATHSATILLAFAGNATLLQGWLPLVPATSVTTVPVSFNGPAWALSCEMFAYLCFPFLGAMLLRRFEQRPARALAAVGAIWAAIVGMGAAAIPLQRETAVQLIYTFPLARLADFTIGILLGIAFLSWMRMGQPGISKVRIWGAGGSSLRWTLLEVASIASLVVAVAMRELVPDQLRMVSYYLPPTAFVLVVFAVGRGYVAKALSIGPLTYLGRMSFAFYIVHFPILVYAQVFGFRGTSVAQVAGLFTVTMVVAWVMHRFVEQWARDAIVARFDPPDEGTAETIVLVPNVPEKYDRAA